MVIAALIAGVVCGAGLALLQQRQSRRRACVRCTQALGVLAERTAVLVQHTSELRAQTRPGPVGYELRGMEAGLEPSLGGGSTPESE